MAKSQGLTLEQIQAIIEDEDCDREDLAEVLLESFEIKLPDDLEGKDLAEYIYNLFQKKNAEIQEERNKTKKRTKIVKEDLTPGQVSRSSFLEHKIRELKQTSRKDLEEILDEAFNYSESGKSPRTRVNGILKKLRQEKKVSLRDGAVKWIED